MSAGTLTDDQFERKLDRLLEIESVQKDDSVDVVVVARRHES